MSQCLNGFFLTVFIVAVSFLRIPFTIISELVWKLAEENKKISLQTGIKVFFDPDFAQIET